MPLPLLSHTVQRAGCPAKLQSAQKRIREKRKKNGERKMVALPIERPVAEASLLSLAFEQAVKFENY